MTWTVNDPTGNFDGRTYDASLVTVYTSPSLHQTLDYDLAEGNAYMQNSGDTGAPSSRTLTITGVNTANVSGATYSAGYILGLTGYGGYNSLSLSNSAGTLALGNPPNDVAQGTDVNFGPSVVSSNVAGSLAATSTVQYSVAMPGGSNNLVPTIGLLAITHPLPVNGVWSSTAGGSWNTAANWQGSNVPTSSGDTATFGDVIGRAAAVVTLDGACTLSTLAFSTTGGGSYTIGRGSGDTTGALTLSNAAAAATVSISGGSQTLAVPITLGSDLTVSVAAGSSLTISGAISEDSPGKSVSLIGGGELVLSGSANYTGGTTVASGTLDFATPESMPSTGILDIERGGEVVLGALLGDSNDSEPAVTAVAAASTNSAGSAEGVMDALLARIRAERTVESAGGDAAGWTIAASPAAAPEPSTLVLLLAAMLALAPVVRRLPFRLAVIPRYPAADAAGSPGTSSFL